MNTFVRWIGVTMMASVLTAGAKNVGVGKDFKGPLGLQLYSLRADFAKNVELALQTMKNFGFKDVELAGTYNMEPAKFRAMLKEHGFNPLSGHFPYARFKNEPEAVA